MPDITGWTGATISATERAQRAWSRIQRDPSEVVLVRDNDPLPAQVLRLILGDYATEDEVAERRGVLFGVLDHPTEPDADVRRGDLFAAEGTLYRVQHVHRLPGELQAALVALQ